MNSRDTGGGEESTASTVAKNRGHLNLHLKSYILILRQVWAKKSPNTTKQANETQPTDIFNSGLHAHFYRQGV